MKADEALLLPSLHKEFENEAVANLFVSLRLVHNVSKYIPTSCWLLLSNRFIVLWEPNCFHKQYDTLLFHKSCDLDISPFYSTWQEQKHPETCWELLAPKPQVQKQELQLKSMQALNVATHSKMVKLYERASLMLISTKDPRTLLVQTSPLYSKT